MELKPKINIVLIFLKLLSMDNYFILSSKDGDKWAKVAPNLTLFMLGATLAHLSPSLELRIK